MFVHPAGDTSHRDTTELEVCVCLSWINLTIKGKQIEKTYQTAVIKVTFERAHWIKNHEIIPGKKDFFLFDSSNFSPTAFFQSQKQLHKVSISLHNHPTKQNRSSKKINSLSS